MGCRIYLVRHGETEWNTTMRYQGHTDIPLSDKGRLQAKLLAGRLAGQKFAGFFASDLKRAHETAQIISSLHGMEINTLPDLRELNFGLWEGLSVKEINKAFPEESKRFWEKPLFVRIPGGETLHEMANRAVAAVKKIVERHSGDNIVIVTHGGVIRSLVGTVLGMDLNKHWRLRLDNACLNIIDFPDWENGILMLFNDCSHLSGAPDCLPGTAGR
ncbi:alpha-ribazole phosphatase [Pelotomaculum propionicicum]|uniref:Alpha-ribazole phosphatase n=1 Tax=Pelotomaculum propionicicum TaxID=258475 RepID=A0A4Y7RV65_9FIRM|nr:alpha-ribazole phosphatase [Pelotomaculum propionicicum]NLI12682.1 alpha-ribazole phosphatase [Peptococcaceae bacterium]TEB12602.1 Phosphoserine phosphatase 1 [Pelotomaculum propionicicum]